MLTILWRHKPPEVVSENSSEASVQFAFSIYKTGFRNFGFLEFWERRHYFTCQAELLVLTNQQNFHN